MCHSPPRCRISDGSGDIGTLATPQRPENDSGRCMGLTSCHVIITGVSIRLLETRFGVCPLVARGPSGLHTYRLMQGTHSKTAHPMQRGESFSRTRKRICAGQEERRKYRIVEIKLCPRWRDAGSAYHLQLCVKIVSTAMFYIMVIAFALLVTSPKAV